MNDRQNTRSHDPRWPDAGDTGSHDAHDSAAEHDARLVDDSHVQRARGADVHHDVAPASAAPAATDQAVPSERPRAGRKTSVGSGLLLILGGLLLASLLTLAIGNDFAVLDGSTSEEPMTFSLMRVAVPAIGLVLMIVAFVLRRSRLTLSLVLLGILSLVGMVAGKVMGEQQLAAASDQGGIQWLQVLFVVCLFAAALIGLLTMIHGLVTLVRKGHTLRGTQARRAGV